MKKFQLIPSQEWFDFDLKITLKPCFRCNQQCWFCEEWDNNSSIWSVDDCELVLSKLMDIPKDKKKIFIYLYGGEPTLSKQWEYLHYRLVDIFKDRQLFIQTQTNLSLPYTRLEEFLVNINKAKLANHVVDVCSSYHIGKQPVDVFIDKLRLCDQHNALGFCFFSTEIEKERQFIEEFYKIATIYPDKLKVKFTQLENLLTSAHRKRYEHYLQDEYLLGEDEGEALEYRYFMRKYPDLRNFFETGWSFRVDGEVLNYNDVKDRGIYRKFRLMRCTAGTNNVVINHDLNVYRCNNYFYENIEPVGISDVNFETYFNCANVCFAQKCTDGLDHTKYR
jgi:organic radical activating enzyme